jgi:hypothetical protein
VELEDIFGDVDAEDVDRHGYSPFIAGSQLARKEGEPTIPLAGGETMALRNPDQLRAPPRLSLCRGARTPCVRLSFS